MNEEDEPSEQREELDSGFDVGPAGEAEPLLDLSDLFDEAEGAASDDAQLAVVLRKIERCLLQPIPGDVHGIEKQKERDSFGDLGIPWITEALSGRNWQGEAMMEFCRIMPSICSKSLLNRAALRDEGFVAATVHVLRAALTTGDEGGAEKACIAICATCEFNDGNKQAAACVSSPTDDCKTNTLILLLEALERFKESVSLQTEASAALRSLISDDDHRKADVTPSALDNLAAVLNDDFFSRLHVVVQNQIDFASTAIEMQLNLNKERLSEKVLLLLREMACKSPDVDLTSVLPRDERIEKLTKPSSNILPFVQAQVEAESPRLVSAALSVLCNFAFREDVRDSLSLSNETRRYVAALRRHVARAVVCKHGFGLLANLLVKNTSMASFLNNEDHEVVSLGGLVLAKHPEKAEVSKLVIQVLWNIARNNEGTLMEVRERELFPVLRKIAIEHGEDKAWKGVMGIIMTFLREFREDECLQRKAVYNQFY